VRGLFDFALTSAATSSSDLQECLDSNDPCKYFASTSCQFEGDTFRVLHDVITLYECQQACQIFGDSCQYFSYNEINNECVLLNSAARDCNILIGPPNPSYEDCNKKTTQSILTETTTNEIKTSESTTTSSPLTTSLKVFVVGGFTLYRLPTYDTEKIDPFVSDSNCTKPSDYPLELFPYDYPTADGVNNELTISCGGMIANGNDQLYIDDCYSYNLTTLEWSFVAKMNEGRSHTASILLNHNKIWITGGFISHGNGGISTKTTEILDIDTLTFSAGPDLPESMIDHCMVTYNETHIFIGSNYCDSYLVDVGQNPFVFHTLPKTTYSRIGAGCAVLEMEFNDNDQSQQKRNESKTQRGIIVVGGSYYPNNSDILFLENDAWVQGPELPRGFSYGGYEAINENEMILVGGLNETSITDNMMMLDTISMKFKQLPGRLPVPRAYFDMTTIFDDESCQIH